MARPRTVVRPLGGYEQYSSSRHSLGLYENVITVCRYTLPAARPEAQVKASIRRAVVALFQEKLPALRVGIAGEDTRQPVYVAVPSLDLADHLEWVPQTPGLAGDQYDAQLMADLERENARPWPDVATRSPWRVRVYLNPADGWADIAFAAHHALADGKSGLVFQNLLVEQLNSEAAPGEEEEEDAAAAAVPSVFPCTADVPELLPPQEELVRFTLSWSFFLGTIWRELGPAWLKRAPTAAAYTGPCVTLAPKLKGHLRVFHLGPAHAAALLAACRAHGTTLTALVHGLVMVLFARRFPADVATSFRCSMPVSMRPYIHAPGSLALDVERNMANLVSSHAYTYDQAALADGRAVADTAAADDDKVWRAAAAMGANLKARLASITEDNIMGLLAWVSDWHDYWRKQEGQIRSDTWTVSNTGSISAAGTSAPGAAAPRWKRTRNFYTQSSMGKDPLVNVNVGGIRGGEMSFVVAWHHGVVETEFASTFTDDLHACLERFGEVGHFSVPNRLSK